MKAVENPDLALSQLLQAGKVMEISKTQAASIEQSEQVRKVTVNNKNKFHKGRVS